MRQRGAYSQEEDGPTVSTNQASLLHETKKVAVLQQVSKEDRSHKNFIAFFLEDTLSFFSFVMIVPFSYIISV